jgi:hypothetical protein
LGCARHVHLAPTLILAQTMPVYKPRKSGPRATIAPSTQSSLCLSRDFGGSFDSHYKNSLFHYTRPFVKAADKRQKYWQSGESGRRSFVMTTSLESVAAENFQLALKSGLLPRYHLHISQIRRIRIWGCWSRQAPWSRFVCCLQSCRAEMVIFKTILLLEGSLFPDSNALPCGPR